MRQNRLMGTGFPIGAMECSGTRSWWLPNIVNALKANGLFTLKWLILRCIHFTSIDNFSRHHYTPSPLNSPRDLLPSSWLPNRLTQPWMTLSVTLDSRSPFLAWPSEHPQSSVGSPCFPARGRGVDHSHLFLG